MEALAFAFVPGALWLSSEVSWPNRMSQTNGTGEDGTRRSGL